MTKDETLKLALEALEPVAKEYAEQYEGEIPSNVADAITAIKEALANDTSQERVDETSKNVHKPCGLECDCTDFCKQVDYKALWQQMCERCDELDKRLAQPEQKFDTHSVPGKSRNTHSRQPEQEPVGEVGQIDIDEDGVGYAWFTIATDGLELGDKLYTSPPQRTQPEQEPVAWIWEKEDGYTSIETHSLDDEDMKNVGVKSIKPLYAKPQFIGLTDDEILSISADCAFSHQHMDIHFARAIEAALKAKNT